MSAKYYLLLIVAATGLGYYGGTRSVSAETAKTEVHTNTETRKDIVKTVKTVKAPDGTTTRESVTKDNSVIDKRTAKVKTVPVSSPVKNRLAVSANTSTFTEVQSYTLTYERRLAGPLWIGINYNTKQVYGLSLGLEF